MRNIVSPRGRSGRSGFVRVAQTDADEGEQRHRLGPARLRETVQQVPRHTPFTAPHNANTSSAQSSPALSDTSPLIDDSISLPIQQFDDVDLTDAHDGYAEVIGSYGPEVINLASDSDNAKAGKGIEVHIKSLPLSESGLWIDDRLPDYSYRGPEGIDEKPPSDTSSRYNYKPAPLRWRFILVLIGGLVTFLALSGLALGLLPNASDMDDILPAFQNISEIRKRSGHFIRPNNDTEDDIPSGVSLTTEISSSAKPSSSTEVSRTTETTLTMHTSSTASAKEATSTTSTTLITSAKSTTSAALAATTTSVASSTTAALTTKTTPTTPIPEITSTIPTKSAEATKTTSIFLVTSVTLATNPISTTEHIPTTEHLPTTEPALTTEHVPTTEPALTTEYVPTTEHVPTTGLASTIGPASATKPTLITEPALTASTSKLGSPSSVESPTEETQPTETPHHTATDQNTAHPTPNGPSLGDHSSPGEFISSTQTTAVNTDHENSPKPTLSYETTTPQYTVDLPPGPSQSLGSTTNKESPSLTLPGPLPGLGTKTTPLSTDGDLSASYPTKSLPPPGSSTISPGKPFTDEHPTPSSSKPIDTESPDSSYQTTDQPKTQPTTQSTDEGKEQSTVPLSIPAQDQTEDQAKSQSGDPQIKSASHDTGISPSITDEIKSTMTSSWKFPTVAITRTSEKIKIYTTSTELGRPEQSPENNDKPFTTITMTQMTETPSPVTTVFTTTSTISNGSFVDVVITTTLLGHIKAADPLTDFIKTTTYVNGTITTISQKVYDNVITRIDTDTAGKPWTHYDHILNSAQVTILKNDLGYPVSTLNYYEVGVVTTLYSGNIAIATTTTIIPEMTVVSTIYDISGRPIKTTTLYQPIPTNIKAAPAAPTPTLSPGPNGQRTLELQRLPDSIYFVGLMLPTLLTILLFIPIKILNRNVNLYQGFHALASDRGASAAESLCLRTTGPASLLDVLQSLQRGDYLLGLTSVMVILSALSVPFSTEVFRLILQGPQCRSGESDRMKCSVTLGVFHVPAQVLLALLIFSIASILVVALLLRRWKTGVDWNPWSISKMAHLAAGTDIRNILNRLYRHRHRHARKHVSTNDFINKLHGKTLGLDEWEGNGVKNYTVLVSTEVESWAETPINKKPSRSVKFAQENIRWLRCFRRPSGHYVPFFILSLTGRVMFLIFLSGVLIAVLTYDIVARGSEYRRGLTGKAVGVRFLFSGSGVLLTFAWGSFFNAIAFLSPYKLLQGKRLKKGEAITVSPATNPFTGLCLAFVPSRRDPYLGVISCCAIAAEFLPLFLGNIPCNGVQLEIAETVSVYLSVAILSMMIFVVGASFFINWPSTMGVDPSTIAGAMYTAHILSVQQPKKRFFKNGVV